MKNISPNSSLKIVFLLIIFSVLTIAPLSKAETIDLPDLQSRSNSGDREAQNLLGVRHFTGDGLPQNNLKAAELFTRSARQGLSKAQFNLAYMHHKGIGLNQDYTKACVWYKAAAEQGHNEAQESLDSLKQYMTSAKLQEVSRLTAQIPTNTVIARNSHQTNPKKTAPEALQQWLNTIQPAAGK
jgi:TPR repeat protein